MYQIFPKYFSVKIKNSAKVEKNSTHTQQSQSKLRQPAKKTPFSGFLGG
jgi:hypothetical protein